MQKSVIFEKKNLKNFQQKKKFKEFKKKENKRQKPHLTDYNLLIRQDLCQTHYQILLIVLLKEFIKLNVNVTTDMIKKNVKTAELNINIVSALLYT